MNPQNFSLEKLARLVQGECVGQHDLQLAGLASLEHAAPQHLAFVNAEKYIDSAEQSKAGALIVTAALKEQIKSKQNFIVVANPYLAFAILTQLFLIQPILAIMPSLVSIVWSVMKRSSNRTAKLMMALKLASSA